MSNKEYDQRMLRINANNTSTIRAHSRNSLMTLAAGWRRLNTFLSANDPKGRISFFLCDHCASA